MSTGVASIAGAAGRAAGTGWLPWTLLLVATVTVLIAFGTTPRDIALFALYIVVGVAVPGMLCVRWLRDRSEHVAEDLGMGLAFGYCVVVGVYTLGRLIGAPLLVLAWPAATITAFVLHPRLRRFWRSSARPMPAWWSWSLVVILAIVLIHSTQNFFALHPLVGTHVAYLDMPFHLSLLGELRHHMPPAIPYVLDTPLVYHWFVYAEAAAASWLTGIEPMVLLYRLSGIPMFVAVVVLTAAGARMVAGRSVAPLAVAIALFATAASPYAWTQHPVFDSQTLIATWISPTNLFALVIITAAIIALTDVLRAGTPRTARRWLLVAVLALGAGGAKSTVLPLLLGGLVMVLAIHAVAHRRLHRPALLGAGIVGGAFLLTMIVIYRGASGGLVIGLDALGSFAVAAPAGPISHLSPLAPILALGVAVVLWSFMWAGAFGLLARRRPLGDPAIGLLIGICLVSLGAVSLLAFPGMSQVYFVRAAAPAFGILTAAGIATVVPAGFRAIPHGPLVVVSAGAGALFVAGVAQVGPPLPMPPELNLRSFALTVLMPIALLTIGAALLFAMLRATSRRSGTVDRLVPLLLVAFVMGFSLPNVTRLLVTQLGLESVTVLDDDTTMIPGDGTTAARWLRANSEPSDLVATNMHCRVDPRGGACDARHFWVSAFAERRVLVEGWAYTQTAIDIGVATHSDTRTVSFWDPELLALNDAAFAAPSSEALSALRDDHGVRWLFASLPVADAEALDRLATLRHRVGGFAVYQLKDRR